MQPNNNAIKQFFAGWQLYQKIVAANYMYHQEFLEHLQRVLIDFQQEITVLELGCGDGQLTAKLLKDLEVAHYQGLDLSSVAINLASKNLKNTAKQITFSEGDIIKILPTLRNQYDLIIAGFSIHHLSTKQKQTVFNHSHRLLAPNGRFLWYDIIKKEGENRSTYMKRFVSFTTHQWTTLAKEEMQALHQHVTTSDYPEASSTLKQMGETAGFRKVTTLFKDQDNFFEGLCFYA